MGAPKVTKQDVIEMLRRLPDDVGMEDIEYHVSVMAGVERGLRDIEAGRVVTRAEVERMMDEWAQADER
jgi:predicted transcriptional regulator